MQLINISIKSARAFARSSTAFRLPKPNMREPQGVIVESFEKWMVPAKLVKGALGDYGGVKFRRDRPSETVFYLEAKCEL
jgi:hypothetical protein